MASEAEAIQQDRPNTEDWKQLRVRAIKPTYGAPGVVACTFFVSIILMVPGIAVVVASDNIFELPLQYDDINSCTYNNHQSILSFTVGNTTVSQGCHTRRTFTLSKTLYPPTYIYYKIVGFHQNYRDYVDSRNDLQVRGDSGLSASTLKACAPLLVPGTLGSTTYNDWLTIGSLNTTLSELMYSPCGAIAWSMFNDTIDVYQTADPNISLSGPTLDTAVLTTVCRGGLFDADGTPLSGSGACTKSGISLSVDLKKRFGNPAYDAYQWTARAENSSNYYRANGYYYGEPGHKLPNATDEDFIVWSRLATMPNFRKLYRRIDMTLLPGTYVLDISEFFDTVSFGGKKYVVLASESWIGGTNYVLGGLLIALGSVSLVSAIAFFMISTLRRTL